MKRSGPDPNYVTDSSLRVRIETHRLYTEPSVDFYPWVLDRRSWSGTETVLDVGCGSGGYAAPVLDRAARYVAGDISQGMLQTDALRSRTRVCFDAEDLPFPEETWDVVLANHMLYHVEDRQRALHEIRRVLRSGGTVFAGTNSEEAMAPLRRLPFRALERLGYETAVRDVRAIERFNLENGEDVMRSVFPDVTVHFLEASLVFPEAEPVLRYVRTLRDWIEPRFPDAALWDRVEATMRRIVEEEITGRGVFRVNKRTGVFVARR